MSGLSAASGPRVTPEDVVTVTSCDDDGSPGTLRVAIEGASDGDTIDMSALTCSTITLQNGPLVSAVPSLKLQGPGAEALTIDGANTVRVLKGNTLDISGLTIANGLASDASGGACVLGSNVSLTDAVLTGCVAINANGDAAGGAVTALADFEMHRSSIRSSSVSGAGSAKGGGVFAGGHAWLYDSTVSGNEAQADQGAAYGGGVCATGTTTLHSSVVDDNRAQSTALAAYGGGIHSTGDVSILDGSTISGNAAHSEQDLVLGGGVNNGTGTYADGHILIIRNSTITGNGASSACGTCLVSGGGVHAFDSIDAASSTFSYNEATCDDSASQCSSGGGGMAALGQSATSAIAVRNATVSGNHATAGGGIGAFAAGGGIMAGGGLRLIARNSTIAFNDAGTLGGGIAATTSAGDPSEIVSTIVADNHSGGGAGDIGAGPFGNALVLEGSNSLVTAADAGVTTPADTSTDEPLLLPLTTDNGGVTATHALATGSPAIDTGANPDGFVFDQRGFPHHRVVGTAADIGAYEFDADPSIFADDFDP